MAERFQEDTYGNVQEKPQPHKKERKEDKLLAWLPWAICILLGIALIGTIWYMGGNKNIIKKQSEKIEQLEDSIRNMSNSVQYDLSKLRINIKELPDGAGGLTRGQTYTCEIIGGQYPQDGYWVISEGENQKILRKNVFKVSSTSGTQVKITYNKGTDVIKERIINVL